MPATGLPTAFSSLLLLGATTASSQVITGTVLGVVRDGSGAVLAGATVTLSSPALPTGPSTIVTIDEGQYRFLNLSPGAYRLEVTLPGFAPYVEEGLRVVVGGTVERSVTLNIARVSESVIVSGRSPIVDTRKAGLSTNYDNELIENTPLRRVSLFDMTKSAPGVSESGEFSRQVSAFGSNTDENLYLVDGTDFTSPR